MNTRCGAWALLVVPQTLQSEMVDAAVQIAEHGDIRATTYNN